MTNGQSARRARTRAALLTAGRELLAQGQQTASIDEITKRAGVGFGSFFNHFPGGKTDLFTECVLELLDGYSAWLREATDSLDDPAERFASSFRLTGRLALAQPQMLSPLLAHGMEVLFVERELRARAIEDLECGLQIGRFVDAPVDVHLVAVGSLLLGLVGMVIRGEGPPVGERDVDQMAATALRALGLTPEDAQDLVVRALPEQDFTGLPGVAVHEQK